MVKTEELSLPDRRNRSVLVVGESHSVAIASAIAARGPGPFSVLDIRPYRPLVLIEDGSPRLDGALAQAIRERVANSTDVVICIGGNQHNILSLIAQAEPYDFRLREHPSEALDQNARLVPEAEIRETMRVRLLRELDAALLVRTLVGRTIWLLEAPPPLGDAILVKQNMEKALAVRDSEGRGIAPAPLRRKVWLLQRSIVSSFCARNDIVYLPAPSETIGTDGFLHRNAYGRDATHGNSWYGEHVLHVLEQQKPPVEWS